MYRVTNLINFNLISISINSTAIIDSLFRLVNYEINSLLHNAHNTFVELV